MTHHDPDLLRPLLAIPAAGAAWLGDQILGQVVSPPDGSWFAILDKYGLPLVLLGLSLWAVLGLYKALQEEKAARLQDAKDALAAYKKDMANAAISRRELLKEMKDQTQAIKEKP